jgi:hypothetical protein
MTATQVTLDPKSLHCVKTGIMLTSPEGLDIGTLNQLIAMGNFVAGTHPGHIKLSPTEIVAMERTHGKLPRYRWAASKGGVWTQYQGWHIGQHNLKVLQSAGFNADPKTLSAGTKCNRQYGVFDAPKPGAPKAAKAPSAHTIAYGDQATKAPPVTQSTEARECPAPTPEEMCGVGSYGRYAGNRKAQGFTATEWNAAWKAAKTSLQSKPQTIHTKRTQPAPVKAAPIAPARIVMPKPVMPKAKPTASTIKVSADSLQATLAALEGATIGGFDGTHFHVTYSA